MTFIQPLDVLLEEKEKEKEEEEEEESFSLLILIQEISPMSLL